MAEIIVFGTRRTKTLDEIREEDPLVRFTPTRVLDSWSDRSEHGYELALELNNGDKPDICDVFNMRGDNLVLDFLDEMRVIYNYELHGREINAIWTKDKVYGIARREQQ